MIWVVFSQFHENQLKNLTTKYINTLKENIEDRFDGNLPVITAFEIFNPTRVPERKETGFKEYGIAEIKVLADYFYHNSEDKEDQTEELLCEWSLSITFLICRGKFLQSFPGLLAQANMEPKSLFP